MNKVIVYCFSFFLLILTGCQKETLHIEETHIAKETENTQKSGYSNAVNTQGNELIILYPKGTKESEKALKRAQYNVLEYKKCECAEPNLELWIFDTDKTKGGGVEEKSATAKVDEEIEDVAYNAIITIAEDQFIDQGVTASIAVGLPHRVAVNSGFTVAVLDTGIMYDYPEFASPFLYNSSENGCMNNGYQEELGWNFVDDNNNPYDNHSGRHGTIVSSMITSTLEAANVDYQILPVKVADGSGNIRYFDALCGFQYAAKKPGVKVINMSFGWEQNDRGLLKSFIEEASGILVVTSAGNKGLDNDVVPHYPSSYPSTNILSVAALSGLVSAGSNLNANGTFANPQLGVVSYLANFSNVGVVSVDIAARGENIPFTYNNEVFYVSGTSYAAAFTSAYAGTLYANQTSGVTLKNAVINNCIYDPDLSRIQYSKYVPVE